MSAQASSRLGTAMLGAASGAAATLAVHRSQQAQSGSPSPQGGHHGAATLPQLQQPTVVHVETSSGTRGGTTALVGGAVLVGGV